MTKGFKAILSASAIMAAAALPVAAQADDRDGLYISAFTGLSLQSDQQSTSAGQTLDIALDNGFVIGGSIGYQLTSTALGALRLELEASYRENNVGTGTFSTDPTAVFSGDNSSLSVFVNGLYDFDLLSDSFIPYVGLGFGFGGVESDTVIQLAVEQIGFGGATRTEFLVQAIAGVTIPINDTFDLFVDGRYYIAPGADFDLVDTLGNAANNFDSSYKTIQIQAGLRFRF
ncbi:MAG: outer membrane beta-barrel protein [Kordiimonadaceae bacterium]|nr:outer membrane beta-barrel protein [Kordiimonadaceae bacterium]